MVGVGRSKREGTEGELTQRVRLSARPRARARPRHWFSAPGEPLPMRTARRTTVAAPPPPEKISGVSMPSTPGGSGSRIGRIGLGFCGAVGFAAGGEGRIAGRPEGSTRCRGLEVSVSGSSELPPGLQKAACRLRAFVALSCSRPSHVVRQCASLAFLHYKM